MIPPNGVLKAAAMPAAPPAISNPLSDTALLAGSQRRTLCMTPAATCTEGPSRPSDNPPSNPQAVSTILEIDSLIDTNSPRASIGTPGVSAAITCGIPDPAVPGATRKVSQTTAAVQAGVQSNGAHQAFPSSTLNHSSATSLIQVRSTTVRPANAANASTSARVAHGRQSLSSLRTEERTWGWRFIGACT